MKTGWPPGMLQDDCRELSKWLSNRVDSRHVAREAAKEIEMSRAEELAAQLSSVDHLECEVAAELRRLDAENAQLKAELEAIYSAVPVAWLYEVPGIRKGASLCKDTSAYKDPAEVEVTLIPLPERKS